MSFLTMKHITIKSLVTLANFLSFLAVLIVFLSYFEKIKAVHLSTMLKMGYTLSAFSIITFIFYHIVRSLQIKKSNFQLLKRHKIYIYSFYYIEYVCFLLNLTIIILINTKVLVNNNLIIVFWVICPIIIIATMIASILESIVRVEERIFINQQQLNNANSNNTTFEENQNNNLQTIKPEINPFLSLQEKENKEKEDNKNS